MANTSLGFPDWDAPKGRPSAKPVKSIPENPFPHIAQGIRSVFKYNFATTVLVLFVTALALSIVSALFVRYAVPQFFTNLLSVSVKDSFWSVLPPTILALWVVLMLLYVVTDCVLYRAILVGVQKQSASLTATIRLVGRRLGLLISTLVFVGILGAAALFSMMALAWLLPELAPPVMVVFAILLVVLFFRYSHIWLVLVDDVKPKNIQDLLGRARAVWQHSAGATILLFLTMVALFFAISFGLQPLGSPVSVQKQQETMSQEQFEASLKAALEKYENTQSPSPLGTPNAQSVSIVNMTAMLFVSSLVSLPFIAGQAHIYTSASQIQKNPTKPPKRRP